MRARDFGLSPIFDSGSDAPIAEHLELDVPELAAVARTRTTVKLVSVGDRRMSLRLGYAEPELWTSSISRRSRETSAQRSARRAR